MVGGRGGGGGARALDMDLQTIGAKMIFWFNQAAIN